MWPALKQQLDRPHCDFGFIEVVHKSMQVPSHLKVAAGAGTVVAEVELSEETPPSFRMYVPDRLLLTEMMDVPFNPQSVDNQLPLESASQMRVDEEPPFLSCASQGSTQEPMQQVYHSHSRKERVGLDDLQLAQQGAGQKRSWPEPDALPKPATPQFPPFPLEGRIYSPCNILWAMRVLGQHLFQVFWAPDQGQCRLQGRGLALQGSLEDSGGSNILAMRKQLDKISRRLRSLEEQQAHWQQKEVLVYAVLLSTCLLNAWLWMRR